jgi:amino acid adenylation domain-containing protein
VESAIANIWQDIIGIERVGVEDDFFELGGESLAAVHMLAAIEDVLLAQVSFADFLDAPTVAGLAAAVTLTREQHAQAGPVLEPGPLSGSAPCTFAQERLWFVDQLAGGTGAYNEPLGVRLRGALDDAAIEQSITELARRHAAFRTSFEVRDGAPVQVVAAEADLELTRIDLSGHADPEAELRSLTEQLASQPFDLERPPLVRAYLLTVAPEDHVVQFVFHHSITDGWSHIVVLRELGQLYRAHSSGEDGTLPALALQYADFARWQRSRLEGPALERALAPWRERLADIPAALDLPLDRPRPPVQSHAGATRRGHLDAATTQAIHSFSRAEGVTAFATLLAVFDVVLHRYSGQDTIMIGSATAGRDRRELEDVVGLFANTIVLRNDLSGDPTFRELLARVRHVVLDAVAHQDAPFEHLVAELQREPDLSRHPIFQVFLSVRPHASLDLPGAEPFYAGLRTARADLTLWVEEAPDGFELVWEYSTDLFEAATIERLERHFVHALAAALAEPESRVSRIPLLDAAERQEVLEAGAAASVDYPVACMHELFEQQAAAQPDAPAVTFEGESLSYGELNERANRLAHRLRELGIGRESLVALFLERSFEMVVAVLAVLKAGGAYVPLDPEYPAARLAFVLSDTSAPVVLTQERLLERLPPHEATVVCLDREDAQLADLSPANLEPLATPESLIYVIYTSGSTGQPKGVQVEHRQVARLFTATERWYGFGPGDTWVLAHSYAFDVSVWELWGALAHGGRIVVSPFWVTRSPEAFAALVTEQGVTVLCATPSLFNSVQEELLRRGDELKVRFVVFAGEALHPASLRPWFDRYGDGGATLVNMYGITETTVHSTYRAMRAADCDVDISPIGVPIPDLSIHLLDSAGEPVPSGVAGELYVGGAGVTRGYLNRPELTAERFLESPFAPERLYRSGDVARRMPGGELEFRGRMDDQVKIRGFRIELGEIQAVLQEHEAVADCAVLPVKAAADDVRLAAYVAAEEELAAQAGQAEQRLRDALRTHLEERLPGYMVPASIMFIDELPLTTNGKLDRRALPAPEWERQRELAFVAPRTAAELLIAEIWQDILGVERVGADDNFFHLGGHSLLAARAVARARESANVELSVISLFEYPTLAAFAGRVEAAEASANASAPAEAEPASAPSRAAEYPLSFQQQQLLFFDQLSPDSATYNSALAVRVDGEVDVELLRAALAAVYARHETLRTVLVWDDSSARQVVREDWAPELPLEDLSGAPAATNEAALQRLLCEHARRPFDLARESPLRTTIFRLAPAEHVILFQPHHVAFDARAVEVLYGEFGEIYGALRAQRSPVLPELPLQYGDFALWQRERLQGELLASKLDFWRAQLAGAPTVLQLPTDHRRPDFQTFEGASQMIVLGQELADAVRDAGRTMGVTPYMVLLAAFATLLYRRSGQDDILVGGPMANRDRAEFEDVIGFIANTIVVRVRLGGNPTFAALLERVRESVLQSYEHQEVPLDLVVDALRPPRDPGMNPLFQVNFRVRVGAPATLELEGTQTSSLAVDLGLARFDLALELHVLDDRILGELNYNTALFEADSIARLAADFEALLRQAVNSPQARLLSFELTDDQGADSDGQAAPGPKAGIRGFRDAGG